MSQEVPLICKVKKGEKFAFQVRKEGLLLLRKLRGKKLRVIWNVTHHKQSLNQFNRWLLGESTAQQQNEISACLTLTSVFRELSQGRVEPKQPPFMTFLGYLAASVFLYHHYDSEMNRDSALTEMLVSLHKIFSETNLLTFKEERTFKKGYAKAPYFRCLLGDEAGKGQIDPFRQFYRYSETDEKLSMAVDVLLDYFPERASTPLALNQKAIHTIGEQFETDVLGRQIFNFEFTGTTLQNLCFECCEAFNNELSFDLTAIFNKIIANHKDRLFDEALQQYMFRLSEQVFGGGKVDLNGQSQLPMAVSILLEKHSSIVEEVMGQTLNFASYCMTLGEYTAMQRKLKERFKQQLLDLLETNAQKGDQLCRECFSLLQNVEIGETNSSGVDEMFGEVTRKLELFVEQCDTLMGTEQIGRSFSLHLKTLQEKLLGTLQLNTVQIMSNLEYQLQQAKTEREEMRYGLKVSENKLRKLQYEYDLQGDILASTQRKLLQEPEQKNVSTYNADANRLRKKVQELEEEVKDKCLQIEDLEAVLDRVEGVRQRDKYKNKFSKETTEMMKDVSAKVNHCYSLLKALRETNELYQQLKNRLANQRNAISEDKKKTKQEVLRKEAEVERLSREKNQLETVVYEARQSIQVYKQVSQQNKQSINSLERTYTQANCLLAETENELELFKKALSLLGQQQSKGRSESLAKFFRVTAHPQLKQLIRPFVKIK